SSPDEDVTAAPTCLDRHAELRAAEVAAYIAFSSSVGDITELLKISLKKRSSLDRIWPLASAFPGSANPLSTRKK
ncbi:hypothetical protein OFB80_29465, partial [Escherichia coli]|nr:hypothetical protein [Escherichia coli]